MSSYGEVVKKLAEQAEERKPCSRCNAPTAVATLSQYGARCFACFEAYCATPQPSRARALPGSAW